MQTILPLTQSHSSFESPLSLVLLPERRGVESHLELGADILSSAVRYLVSEQLAGRRGSVKANRQAIAILCEAGREIAQQERRRSAKHALAEWLKSASIYIAATE